MTKLKGVEMKNVGLKKTLAKKSELKREATTKRGSKPAATTQQTSKESQQLPKSDKRETQQQQKQAEGRKESKKPADFEAVENEHAQGKESDSVRLRHELEHLAQLPAEQFEHDFRKWMAQEEVARDLHAHMRMDLINSFNNTALGQQLQKLSNSALDMQQQCLLLSPLALTLNTLVAEFLLARNCHYTLSVFCSEMPHRHMLPDFDNRPCFRFSDAELRDVLGAVMGFDTRAKLLETLQQMVQRNYTQYGQSLLFAMIKALIDVYMAPSLVVSHVATETETMQSPSSRSCYTQTEPATCLQAQPGVNFSQQLQAHCNAEELILSEDGRSVFIGPRVSQVLLQLKQQMAAMTRHMRALSESCLPPTEVMSRQSFENLMQQELEERERLARTAQPLPLGQLALPELVPKHVSKPKASSKQYCTINTEVGPIRPPDKVLIVPKLPLLHGEQLASLTLVRQLLDGQQQQGQQSQSRIYTCLQRVECFIAETSICVQALSNVLNLTMEQEHAIGSHKGFKSGYKEGFAHGHCIGVQEAQLEAKAKVKETPAPVGAEVAVQTMRAPRKQCHVSTGMELGRTRDAAVQKSQPALEQRHRATGMELGSGICDAVTQTAPVWQPKVKATNTEQLNVRDASVQTPTEPQKTYESWIHEMLHTASGQVFLDRVELSLNKALDMQRQRLDELYDIKLRHQSEMMRLQHRQSSWRSLCRRVERDSSGEARELVHKIFCLLEHYEAHQRTLVERIQETEIAAEQAARIQPPWGEPAWSVPPTSEVMSSSSTETTTASITPLPEKNIRLQHRQPLQRPNQSLGLTQTPSTLISGQAGSKPTICSEPVTNAPPIREPVTNAPPISGPVSNAPPISEPVTKAPPISATAIHAPAISTSVHSASVLPVAQSKPAMHTVATNTVREPKTRYVQPPRPKLHAKTHQSFENILLSAKNRMLELEQESEQLEQSFFNYLERARVQELAQEQNVVEQKTHKIRASCARERQQMHEMLDSYRSWQRRGQSDVASSNSQLSAQIERRIKALEQELNNNVPLHSGSEQEDSYHFTNAISVARQQLFAQLKVAQTPEPCQNTDKFMACQVSDWCRPTQSNDAQELLDRMEPQLTPTAVARTRPHLLAELDDSSGTLSSSERDRDMSQLMQRAQWTTAQRSATQPSLMASLLEHSDSANGVSPNNGSTSTTSLLTPPPRSNDVQTSVSRKLQRSMAKMQQLFSSEESTRPQTFDTGNRAKHMPRPVSAPTRSSSSMQLQPQRPQTAPSAVYLASSVAWPPLDPHALPNADTSANSSSFESNRSTRSELRARRASYAQLVNNCSIPAAPAFVASNCSSPSSPELSYSQEFWKRLNM